MLLYCSAYFLQRSECVQVILGSLVTFFFTYFFYGWASLQALLEADGVYLAVSWTTYHLLSGLCYMTIT